MILPRLRGVVLTGVVALLLSGCGLFASDEPDGSAPEPALSPSPVETSGSATPSPGPGLQRFYTQRLTWKKCRDHDECSELLVPLDYTLPQGRTIRLSLLRVPAARPDSRIGSLVVNPGGPGVSGVDYAASADGAFGAELLSAFDIVGFDPRGVGASTPLECVGTGQLDDLVASDPDPDTPAEVRESDRLLSDLGSACVAHDRALVRHMSTVEVDRDLDILRAALGDRKLFFLGASYGTFIGAKYADLFPKRVGRMVLDGALDPALETRKLNLVQARAFEVALRAYVGHCVDAGQCFLGDSLEAGTRRIREFLDSVEESPLPGLGSRTLQSGTAVLGIWLPLYNKDYWGLLDQALKSAFGGSGAALLSLADAYLSRGPNGYLNNQITAQLAVNCLDHDDAVPSAKVEKLIPRFEKVSATFGAVFAYGMSACASWPVHTGTKAAPVEARGAPPILVVGTTRDPATPLAWARSLAEPARLGRAGQSGRRRAHRVPRRQLVRRHGGGVLSRVRQGPSCGCRLLMEGVENG